MQYSILKPILFLFAGLMLVLNTLSASAAPASQTDKTKVSPTEINLTLAPGETATRTITVRTSIPPIPLADVLFLFDVTSSMSDVLEAAKSSASTILATVKAQVGDVNFGVASLADYPEYYDFGGYAQQYGGLGDYPWRLEQEITADTDAVQTAINRLELRDGQDGPEDYSRALFEAIGINWRPGTKHIVVFFADAVAHDTSFYGENFGVDPGRDGIPGTSDDLEFDQVVGQLRARKIEVIVVNSDRTREETITKGFRYIADETGGEMIFLDDAAQVSALVTRGLVATTAQIGKLEIVPPAEYQLWLARVEPPAHTNVGGGVTREFNVTLTVPKETKAGAYSFDLTVSGDGARLGNVRVNINVTAVSKTIILLPGFGGSTLVNHPTASECSARPNGEIWLNAEALLRMQKLSLPKDALAILRETRAYNERLNTLLLQQDGRSARDKCDAIQPGEMISVDPRGVKYGDFYQRFTAVMTKEYGYTVIPFAYDWRLDLEQNAKLLERELEKRNLSQVILIGHSMGGLLAREFVADASRAQKVEKVISVGTPYWGLPKVAMFMRSGTTGIDIDKFVDKATVKAALRNAPGVMQLLPSDAYFAQYGSASAYYYDDIESLDSYDETLRFFTEKSKDPQASQNKSLIESARQMHRGTDDFRSLTVPYFVLAANHLDAVNAVREYPCKWTRLFTCVEPLGSYLSGDGTVPWSSARLRGIAGDWAGKEVCTYRQGSLANSNTNHASLLSDDAVLQDIKHILDEDAKRNCQVQSKRVALPGNSNAFIQSALPSRIRISVKGQATVLVRDADRNITGVGQDGLIAQQIPFSTVDVTESGTFIGLSSLATYQLNIVEDGATAIQVEVTEIRADALEELYTPQRRAVFVELPIQENAIATMALDPNADFSTLRLAVDLNADGTPETELSPSSILNPREIEDLSRPSTTISTEAIRDNFGRETDSLRVTLTATDSGTGILKTEYSLDEGITWQLYATPFTAIPKETPTLYARSIDRAGNHEFPYPNLSLPTPTPREDSSLPLVLGATFLLMAAGLILALVLTRGSRTASAFLLMGQTRIAIRRSPFRIGRDLKCQIHLAGDTQVSRVHAEIRREPAGYIIYDLQSRNGTFVNGKRITRHLLKHGDQITVGQSTLVFMG